MRKSLYIAFFIVCILTASVSFAETITGKVVGVHDGDTITMVDHNNQQLKIRLAEIDAPELDQPYGNKSKKMLSDLIFGSEIKVVTTTKDRYGRTIGRIYRGETDVNLTMVKQGGTWAYQQYLTDDAIRTAEETAKANHIGLWALQEDQRLPPWEWRHPSKQTKIDAIQQEAENQAPRTQEKGTFKCEGKTVCREMASCKEAKFYLNNCNLGRLDGDKDGIPCESLCR